MAIAQPYAGSTVVKRHETDEILERVSARHWNYFFLEVVRLTDDNEKGKARIKNETANVQYYLISVFLCQTYIVNQKQSSASTENKEQARKQRAQLGVGLD